MIVSIRMLHNQKRIKIKKKRKRQRIAINIWILLTRNKNINSNFLLTYLTTLDLKIFRTGNHQ